MEVDSQLDVSIELGYISKENYEFIENQMDSIGKQLSALRNKYQVMQ
jgi:four helix bundle protein